MTDDQTYTVEAEWIDLLTERGVEESTAETMVLTVQSTSRLGEYPSDEELRSQVTSFLDRTDLSAVGADTEDTEELCEALLDAFEAGLDGASDGPLRAEAPNSPHDDWRSATAMMASASKEEWKDTVTGDETADTGFDPGETTYTQSGFAAPMNDAIRDILDGEDEIYEDRSDLDGTYTALADSEDDDETEDEEGEN